MHLFPRHDPRIRKMEQLTLIASLFDNLTTEIRQVLMIWVQSRPAIDLLDRMFSVASETVLECKQEIGKGFGYLSNAYYMSNPENLSDICAKSSHIPGTCKQYLETIKVLQLLSRIKKSSYNHGLGDLLLLLDECSYSSYGAAVLGLTFGGTARFDLDDLIEDLLGAVSEVVIRASSSPVQQTVKPRFLEQGEE